MRVWPLLCYLMLAAWGMVSCQSLSGGDSDQEQEGNAKESSSNHHLQNMSSEEMELKLARLWARVDEMETRQLRHHEKIRLLEQGLMLGIIPENLQSFDSQPLSSNERMGPEPVLEREATELVMSREDDTPRKAKPSEQDERSYQRILSEAQSKFNAGNYGQAIADYQKIHELYPDHTLQGQHLYWIGLGWYYLREDNLAAESLDQLIQQYGASPWLPKARFYRAKLDLRQGYRQKALQGFRGILQDYPEKDVAEMAKHELSQLSESL